jgi:hypothetical protein
VRSIIVTPGLVCKEFTEKADLLEREPLAE